MKHYYLIFSSVFALILLPNAFALPLFSENRAIRLASGVVLYPDSEDPKLVYYFPGTGALKSGSDGLPLFGLTYWGLRRSASGEITVNPDSGAFFTFNAALGFTDAQRAEVTAILGTDGRVAVLPVRSSTIELNSTSASGAPLAKFFEEFNLSRRGGQADSDIAVNASLNGIGARLFTSQLKNPAFMKFDYCYQSLGLSPLFKGIVHLNWKTVYETLKATYSTGGFFTKREVSVTLQKLIRDGALQIQIDAAPDSEAKYEEFTMKVANMLMERMFKNELPMNAPGSEGSGWSFFRISLDYGRTEVSEDITITFLRREQKVFEACVPISIGGIKDHFNDVVRTADGISIF